MPDAGPRYLEDHLDEACGALLPGCHWAPWNSTLTREVDGATAAAKTSTAPAALQAKAGDKYLRHKVGGEKVTSGPKSLASAWGIDGAFAKGVDDACRVPGVPGDLYFFKGDQYVRVR
ncbi:BP74-related protein [Streptomyces adustus]